MEVNLGSWINNSVEVRKRITLIKTHESSIRTLKQQIEDLGGITCKTNT